MLIWMPWLVAWLWLLDSFSSSVDDSSEYPSSWHRRITMVSNMSSHLVKTTFICQIWWAADEAVLSKYFVEKVLLYFGLDCGLLVFSQIFYSQAVIPRTIVDSLAFLDHGSAERSWFVAIQPVIPTRRMIRGIFVWSGSELWTLLKYSRSKLINQMQAVDVLFKAYLMIPLSGWSTLAGRYLLTNSKINKSYYFLIKSQSCRGKNKSSQ